MGENGKIYMTLDGVKQLEDELDYLITVKRKENAEDMGIAIGFGDLSENAEYEQALKDRESIERRISVLKGRLLHVEIVDDTNIDKNVINVGAYITLKDFDGGVFNFTLVGEGEGDINQGKVSISSPVGKSLLGQPKNTCVNVEAPDGIIKYKVLNIKY